MMHFRLRNMDHASWTTRAIIFEIALLSMDTPLWSMGSNMAAGNQEKQLSLKQWMKSHLVEMPPQIPLLLFIIIICYKSVNLSL